MSRKRKRFGKRVKPRVSSIEGDTVNAVKGLDEGYTVATSNQNKSEKSDVCKKKRRKKRGKQNASSIDNHDILNGSGFEPSKEVRKRRRQRRKKNVRGSKNGVSVPDDVHKSVTDLHVTKGLDEAYTVPTSNQDPFEDTEPFGDGNRRIYEVNKGDTPDSVDYSRRGALSYLSFLQVSKYKEGSHGSGGEDLEVSKYKEEGSHGSGGEDLEVSKYKEEGSHGSHGSGGEDLEVSKYKEEGSHGNDDDEEEKEVDADEYKDECTMCDVKFVEGVDVIRMPCSHVYHKRCLVLWLNMNHDCPFRFLPD